MWGRGCFMAPTFFEVVRSKRWGGRGKSPENGRKGKRWGRRGFLSEGGRKGGISERFQIFVPSPLRFETRCLSYGLNFKTSTYDEKKVFAFLRRETRALLTSCRNMLFSSSLRKRGEKVGAGDLFQLGPLFSLVYSAVSPISFLHPRL